MQQSEEAHASVHQGDWKLVAHGDAFAEELASELVLELYDLAADPAETLDVSAEHPELVSQLQALLREFGTSRRAGVGAYDSGRMNFRAPVDWVIK